jgi:purine-binding chemotaxis protein CheW
MLARGTANSGALRQLKRDRGRALSAADGGERLDIMTESAASAPLSTSQFGAGQGRTAATTPTQLISFAIGDDQYGVDIMAVREIKGWTEITHLPRQPDYVRGVLNLRGVIVPIIDLRCRFGQGLTEATPLHIVIIVQIASKPIGLLADRVLDIVSLDEVQIQPVPRIAQASRVEFLSGLATIDGAMIALIDLSNLLSLHVDGEELAAGEAKTAAFAQRR